MASPTPPAWLAELAEDVTGLMVPTEVMAPIGCHFHREASVWEVTIFASVTEVVGGQQDGMRFPAHFLLDVGGVIGLFSDVDSVKWQVLDEGPDDELGAHLAVEGIYRSERLLLRIPAQAPRRFDVGRVANVYEKRFVDIW